MTTRSNSDRLTPGIATAVVFYLAAALMAIAVVGLTIAAGNDAIIVSAQVHFGMAVAALIAAGSLQTVAAAAYDQMFTWPRGGPVDPAPYQRMPDLDWGKAHCAMTLNFYFIAAAFAIVVLGLAIAAGNSVILFSPVTHFMLCAISFIVAAVSIAVGGKVQDNADLGPFGLTTAFAFTSVALAVVALGFAIAGGNDVFIFGEVFTYSFALGAFAAAAVYYYCAAREYDVASRSKTKLISVHMFVIAGVLAAAGVILALIGINTVVVSVAFHIGMVVSLVVTAFVLAVFAALTMDRG